VGPVLIAGIAIGVLVLVAGIATWTRFSRARTERRSVTTHQHALDVLGTVSRRWEGVAPVRAPKPGDVARAHVQPTGSPPSARRPEGDELVPTRRSGVRLVPPSGPRPVKLPIFIDEGVTGTGALAEPGPGDAAGGPADLSSGLRGRRGRATLYDDEALEPDAEGEARSSRRTRHRYRGGHPARRATSTAALAVAVAAVGVASWQLASGGGPARHATKPPPSNSEGKKHHHPGGHKPGQGVAPTSVSPTSVSPSVVTYRTAGPTYTLSFAATGACWLGVQQGVNGGYLWQTTLQAGEKATYKASGSVAVRLGAPQYVNVQLNGVKVDLPAQNVQPYDITFSPPRNPAA